MAAILFSSFYILSLLGQSVLSQCIGRESILGIGISNPFGWPYEGPFDGAYGPALPGAISPFAPACGLAAAYGGGLAVTSTSPIAPTGLTVDSQNTVEGVVTVTGQLPFLGAVAADGIFSTAGAGVVSYGCGDGTVGIIAEAPIVAAAAPPAFGYGSGVPQYGYGTTMSGYNSIAPFGGYGCNTLY